MFPFSTEKRIAKMILCLALCSSVITHSSYDTMDIEHLVLDLDGTLIGLNTKITHDVIEVTVRPYLKDFFDFVFSHFKTVSIWTAANVHWWNSAYEVLKEHMPVGAGFTRIWTHEDCTVDEQNCLYKPLEDFVDDIAHLGADMYNTMIIDDTPHTYRANKINAIAIKPYNGEEEDFQLVIIMRAFVNLRKQCQEHAKELARLERQMRREEKKRQRARRDQIKFYEEEKMSSQ